MTKRIAVVTELLWSLRWHYDMAAGVQQYAAKMGLEWKIDVLPHPEALVERGLASYDGAVGRLTQECVTGLGDIPMVNTWVASPVRRP